MDFKNKIVWITGASSGIGEALVYLLNEQGAKLIISSRRSGALYEVKQRCRKNPLDVHVLPLDLAQADTLTAKAENAWRIYGAIDILINAGGISQRGTVLETAATVEQQIMNVNFWGTVNLSKAILPKMLQRKQGNLVVISSVVGKFGTQFRSTYSASKHALHGYFDSLRCEVYDQGVSVNIICPGFVKTNVTINSLTAQGEKHNHMDEGQENGISATQCAHEILKSVAKNKEETLIGGKETYGVYLKRFFPGYFSKMIRKRKVVG
ncbi:short-chain dehydrogenase [Pelobium manganitolerans]|uniref:Short-chain dehydrogenase n=1 Tax=Pelobium manganitolerans TaxID=1842495 RepID=A0A419S2F6_9SPHI|nr:SDR family oxidoreductase [Pelobium manganitolerans]RKD12887.1 short-chain dehydrogenase [Pelobium manganitolerans]